MSYRSIFDENPTERFNGRASIPGSRLALFAFFIVATLAGCAESETCADASDCFRGEACVDNLCVPGNSSAGPNSDNATPSNGGTENASTANSTPNGSPNGSPNNTGPNNTAPNNTAPNNTDPNNTSPNGPLPIKVVAGEELSCALLDSGEVLCWGENADNRLGTALDTEAEIVMPEKVLGISGAVDLVAGDKFACALNAAGTATCWGLNRNIDTAQTFGNVIGPTPLVFSGITKLDINYLWGCAALGDGTLINCFGRSSGDDDPPPNITAPAEQLAVGREHACVLSDGDVYCWGSDFYRQLGVGSPVRGLSDIIAIDAGEQHTCALDSAGDVYCWGWNEEAQCGTLPVEFHEKLDMPQKVPGVSGIVGIATASTFSCGWNEAGRTWCWGAWEGYDGSIYRESDLNEPVTPTGLGSGIVNIGAGDLHACALRDDNVVFCWGNNEHRQLGNDLVFRTETPQRVVFP